MSRTGDREEDVPPHRPAPPGSRFVRAGAGGSIRAFDGGPMTGWRVAARGRWAVCVAIGMLVTTPAAAQQAPQQAKPIAAGEVPQKKKAAALVPRGTYVPVKTPWGDPDI